MISEKNLQDRRDVATGHALRASQNYKHTIDIQTINKIKKF